MTVAVASFDNPEVMQVPQGGGLTLFVCTGVALTNYAGNSGGWRRDDLVFLVPEESAGGNPPALTIPNFHDSVVTVTPATFENNNVADVGWGIDSADSIVVGNNIQVTARIVVKGNGAQLLRVAYHVLILG